MDFWRILGPPPQEFPPFLVGHTEHLGDLHSIIEIIDNDFRSGLHTRLSIVVVSKMFCKCENVETTEPPIVNLINFQVDLHSNMEIIYHEFCGGEHRNFMISRLLGTPVLEHFGGPGGLLWHQFGGHLAQVCAQAGSGVSQGRCSMNFDVCWAPYLGHFFVTF